MSAIPEALPKVSYIVLCHWNFGCLNVPVFFSPPPPKHFTYISD